jgi:FKBP-type peptidyl-prolyl cis-trans isomerase FkpA
MKKLRFICILLAGMVLFTGCFRDDSEKLKEEEQRDLKKYLADHNITQSPTASGLYFIQVTDTVGLSPTVDDVVEFEYTGRLVDGRVFGTTDSAVAEENGIYYENMIYGPVRLILNYAITGLQEGFQLMQEGETARMILPSDIAYGPNSIGIIEPYNTLIFDIHLLHVISNPDEYELILIRNFLDSNNYEAEPTESGLYYIEKVPGDDVLIKPYDLVDFYYRGYFLDGREIGSNFDNSYPFTVHVPDETLIQGWNEGLQLMSKGSEGILIIPYNLAYGALGTQTIGPYMTLVFDIKIVDVR